jgi:hypothetical protein
VNYADAKALFAIAAGYLAFAGCGCSALKRTLQLAKARHWPGVRGRVLESTEYIDPRSGKTHFRVRYEFVVGDRIESATPRLAGDWFVSNKDQTDFVARYRAGQEIEVFYDPRNPTANCLDRTDKSGIKALWILSLGGGLLATVLVVMLAKR